MNSGIIPELNIDKINICIIIMFGITLWIDAPWYFFALGKFNILCPIGQTIFPIIKNLMKGG